MFVRYGILTLLAGFSCYIVLVAGATSSQMLLAHSDMGAMTPHAGLWGLAAVAGLTVLSLMRFLLHGVPTLCTNWYFENRASLILLCLTGAAGMVFYWLV